MVDFWIQFGVIILCLAIGARYGGAGLGVAGGLGLAVLVLIFHIRPGNPPIDVLLIITAVITCASFLQASGGLDYLISIADRMLRRNPNAITFMGPLVCYCFTLFCGTSYVALSIYPVIAEVAIEARVRPERALSMSVIAAQAGITGSPMSAATGAMIGMLAVYGVTPLNILLVCIPACLLAILTGCLYVFKRGPELADDPEFQRRVASGEFVDAPRPASQGEQSYSPQARRAVIIFALGIGLVVILGAFKSLLPSWNVGGKMVSLSIPAMIQIVMMAVACAMMLVCGVSTSKAVGGSVFRSGMTGVVAVWGISWLSGTFFHMYQPQFISVFGDMLKSMPFLFAIALIFLSCALASQGATVTALMPLGLTLGIAPPLLVAMFPAANGYFMVPAGASMIGCIAFDRTGTTKVGKYVLNHSYMMPGWVTTITSLVYSYLLSLLVF